MASARSTVSKQRRMQANENAIFDATRKLGDLIRERRLIYGGTGIPMPKPPRPLLEVVGLLNYYAFVLNDSFRSPRRR